MVRTTGCSNGGFFATASRQRCVPPRFCGICIPGTIYGNHARTQPAQQLAEGNRERLIGRNPLVQSVSPPVEGNSLAARIALRVAFQ